MQKKPDLIGFGAVTVDDLLYLSGFPQPDSKQQVFDQKRFGGGLAGTALVAAARLGTHASYFGVFGANELSSFVQDTFQLERVQTDLCLYEEGAQPVHSTILVDQTSGSRTILYANDHFQLPPISTITKAQLEGCRMVFIDSASLPIFDHVVFIARSLHIPILTDIEDNSILEHQSSLDAIDHLILGERMACDLTGEHSPSRILNALETPMRKICAITDGENGCWFKEPNRPVYHMPAFPVHAVDTTGCGDVFHGAYAAAVLHHSNLPNAIVQASAAAALKATKPGGQAGIPDFTTLKQFIDENRHIQPYEID